MKSNVMSSVLLFLSVHMAFYALQSIMLLISATPLSLKFNDFCVSESKTKTSKIIDLFILISLYIPSCF